MKPLGIIYKATNNITGMCYIGQTIQKLYAKIIRRNKTKNEKSQQQRRLNEYLNI